MYITFAGWRKFCAADWVGKKAWLLWQIGAGGKNFLNQSKKSEVTLDSQLQTAVTMFYE